MNYEHFYFLFHVHTVVVKINVQFILKTLRNDKQEYICMLRYNLICKLKNH